jgi:hypothetical protein
MYLKEYTYKKGISMLFFDVSLVTPLLVFIAFDRGNGDLGTKNNTTTSSTLCKLLILLIHFFLINNVKLLIHFYIYIYI